MSKTKQGEGKRSKAGRGEEKGNRAGGAEFGDVVAVGDTACVTDSQDATNGDGGSSAG